MDNRQNFYPPQTPFTQEELQQMQAQAQPTPQQQASEVMTAYGYQIPQQYQPMDDCGIQPVTDEELRNIIMNAPNGGSIAALISMCNEADEMIRTGAYDKFRAASMFSSAMARANIVEQDMFRGAQNHQ